MADIDISGETGADLSLALSREVPVFTFLLVKLASRCNIKCTYCYWFRDADVYKKPAVLTIEGEDAFCKRLEEHITEVGMEHLTVGRPGARAVLVPKNRFT